MGERYGLFFEEFPADYPEKSRALLTGFALSGIQGYLFGRINGEWTPARVRRASRYVSLATEAVGAYLVRAHGGIPSPPADDEQRQGLAPHGPRNTPWKSWRGSWSG